MNDDQVRTLRTIFCEELGIQDSELQDSTAYNQLESWDSLTHLKIVSRIEDAFSIEMEVDDIIGMETFAKAKETMAKYLG